MKNEMLFTEHHKWTMWFEKFSKIAGSTFLGCFGHIGRYMLWEHITNICNNNPITEDAIVSADEVCEAIKGSESDN